MILQVKPIVDPSVRALCSRPYYNHKKGCPQFGKKKGCPPGAPILDYVIDVNQPVFAIFIKFDFAEHVQRMGDKHPEWSQRQKECCLYWQGKARKILRAEIEVFKASHPGDWWISECPEACGLQVTHTMANVGVKLEWPPVNFTYRVAIAGKLLPGAAALGETI